MLFQYIEKYLSSPSRVRGQLSVLRWVSFMRQACVYGKCGA